MRRPLTAAKRKEMGARMAAGRAKAKAEREATMARIQFAPPPSGHNNPPPDQPAFLNDTPQPEARPQPQQPPSSDQKAKDRAGAIGTCVMIYAGAHFFAANATQIEHLQVSQDEAVAVSEAFVKMMDAWGYDAGAFIGGKWGATLAFGFTFGMIELQKLRVFNMVMAQRQAEARERARQQQNGGATPQATNNMPNDAVGPDAMNDPFANMRAEAAE